MSDTKAAWDEVGSAFAGLGVKLKAHFDHTRTESQAPPEAAESATPTAPPEPSPGAAEAASADAGAADAGAAEDAATKERDVKEAFHRLGEALEGAFEALGSAVRDPAMKDDVKHVGQSLGTALSSTFADVSEELRKVLKRSGKDGDTAADPNEASTGTDGSAANGSGDEGKAGA
jgi:hypothetical protein